ncbi:MAG: hypothetical protein QW063_02540 [Candidatus Nanoarchaeia archaeon]
MMLRKGQTWIEFIVATVVFLFIIAFLFISATLQVRDEVEKIQLQTACMKANALVNLLQQPGSPINWQTTNGVDIFGLSNSDGTSVLLAKWLRAKEFGYVNISVNSTPSSPWKLSYKIYAFEPKIDTNCAVGDAITICRDFDKLGITANSSQQAQSNLILFLPFSTASLGTGSTNESDDIITLTHENGTRLYLRLNTNSTDQDFINLTFMPNPNLIFIESVQIEGVQKLTLFLGNVSAIDSFGAQTIDQRNLCTFKTKGLLKLTNETVLVDWELLAW